MKKLLWWNFYCRTFIEDLLLKNFYWRTFMKEPKGRILFNLVSLLLMLGQLLYFTLLHSWGFRHFLWFAKWKENSLKLKNCFTKQFWICFVSFLLILDFGFSWVWEVWNKFLLSAQESNFMWEQSDQNRFSF